MVKFLALSNPVIDPLLASKGLTAEAFVFDDTDKRTCQKPLLRMIRETVFSAYPRDVKKHFMQFLEGEDMLVVLKDGEKKVVACMTLRRSGYPEETFIQTRGEAVLARLQRQGYGTLMFLCGEAAAKWFLLRPENHFYIMARGGIELKACVDAKDRRKYSAFMAKCGFKEETSDAEEITYYKFYELLLGEGVYAFKDADKTHAKLQGILEEEE